MDDQTPPVGIEPLEGAVRKRVARCWNPTCPVPLEELRRVRIQHLGFDGNVHGGELIVAAKVTDEVLQIFGELREEGFPIERVHAVDEYGCSDARSMEANNTSAFNCRKTTSGGRWSEHAFGTAIDINPVQNPYVRGGAVEPSEGRAYVDRTEERPGMILPDGAVEKAFAVRGWAWGGRWKSLKDYQHFSISGR